MEDIADSAEAGDLAGLEAEDGGLSVDGDASTAVDAVDGGGSDGSEDLDGGGSDAGSEQDNLGNEDSSVLQVDHRTTTSRKFRGGTDHAEDSTSAAAAMAEIESTGSAATLNDDSKKTSLTQTDLAADTRRDASEVSLDAPIRADHWTTGADVLVDGDDAEEDRIAHELGEQDYDEEISSAEEDEESFLQTRDRTPEKTAMRGAATATENEDTPANAEALAKVNKEIQKLDEKIQVQIAADNYVINS